ncbi:MAG: Flp pilus assembly complex ATPase component TadA, partial [Candidatus Marinimicrobia bacterium]|nr:Flp pilus assembly complex ATPase component TadA [Candidatus Neomarinimicrobiota bacterium]
MVKIGKQLFGQLLIKAGKINEDQLSEVLQDQNNSNEYLGNLLIEKGFLDEVNRNEVLSLQLKVPQINLRNYSIDLGAIQLISEKIIREFKVLPLFELQGTLNVALSDPLDPAPINAIREVTGLKVEPIIVTTLDLENSIDLHYGMSNFVTSYSESGSGQPDTDELFDESKVVELINRIIEQSRKYDASDIHIEPREKDIRVRFRIDGRLQEFQNLPLSISTALVSRLKIMANMDIAEARRPQDG